MSTTNEPPAHRHMFRPGQMINESGYEQFHPYLTPKDNEPDHDYARRLDKEGMAVAVTSDDARDLAKYRGLLAKAENMELPIVMLTAESENQAVRVAEQVKQESPLSDPVKMQEYIRAEREKLRR